MKDKAFAKKRMMYIQKEDYNFLTYILIVFLYSLDCTNEKKKFRDFRKIAYLIEFVNSGGDISKYSQNELANIYSKTHIKKQLLSHVLFVLKNKRFIGVEVNTKYRSFDLWLNMDNIPSEFINKEYFKNEITNTNALKVHAHSLKTVPLKKLVDSIYTSNNIITWEI